MEWLGEVVQSVVVLWLAWPRLRRLYRKPAQVDRDAGSRAYQEFKNGK